MVSYSRPGTMPDKVEADMRVWVDRRTNTNTLVHDARSAWKGGEVEETSLPSWVRRRLRTLDVAIEPEEVSGHIDWNYDIDNIMDTLGGGITETRDDIAEMLAHQYCQRRACDPNLEGPKAMELAREDALKILKGQEQPWPRILKRSAGPAPSMYPPAYDTMPQKKKSA